MKRFGFLAGAAAAVLVAGCNFDFTENYGSRHELAAAVFGPCGVAEQNLTVSDILRDWYFWLDELGDADPLSFASPEAYLDAVRYQELDRFSYITDAAADEAFFSESEFIGVGLRQKILGNQLFIADVFAGSPAEAGGLQRGFEILSINGEAASVLIAEGRTGSAFGPDEEGVQVELVYRDGAGNTGSVTLVKERVTIPTVPDTDVFVVNGVTVGYIRFDTFTSPAEQALNDAFATMQSSGATELILDMRYNGGGLLSVAQHLAGLIGGDGTSGSVFARFVHNRLRSGENFTLDFANPSQALDLDRVIFITTGGSASATEAVINGLEPFLDVVLVGADTFGKPVGQYGFDFCGKTLRPVSFEVRNANDVGNYYDGLPVDCAAEDQLEVPLGDPAEASLAEALNYLETGACSVSSAKLAARRATQKPVVPPAARRYGWQVLVGAE